MITHFGYTDASGKYYISIDAEKCNGCKKCIESCPQQMFEIATVMIDLDDKDVASIKENQRNKIKYTCSDCKKPCESACELKAITVSLEK